MKNKIPLTRPYITEETIKDIIKVLKSGYLTEGSVTNEFEKSITQYVGCQYVISFNSNTTGMETALRAIGVGKGDEVIIPNYTYPATANVIYLVGAKPVIVDVDKETANIDYGKIEKAITFKTKAILPVSLFGNPLNYRKLNQIKRKYNLKIVEDSACSLGSKYNKTMTGNLADVSIFSFHPRKFITTGEGGMLTTNDEEIAKFAKSYKCFGMNTKKKGNEIILDKMDFIKVGSNFKLSNINSAIGLSQMKIINQLLSERDKLAKNYDFLLKDLKEVKILKGLKNGKQSYQSYCIRVPFRDKLIIELKLRGIETQIGSIVLSEQISFKNTKIVGSIKDSEILGKECLALPFYNGMLREEQKEVVENLKELLVKNE